MSFPFAAQIIILLLAIGGVIAYIGNYVGKSIGKKRLTVFNLRPRHTAMTITVISGVLIAFLTLGVLLAVSQDARTAFLGLDKLKSQIGEKTQELSAANEALKLLNDELSIKLAQQQSLEASLTGAKSEIGQLNRAKQRLSREVAVTRQGEVVFKKGEVITLSLIQAGPEQSKIEAGLKQILTVADANLRRYGIKGSKLLVTVASENFDQTIHSLTGQNKMFVVKLIALRNTLWGEEVPAQFDILENKLVFKENAEIAAGEIAAKLSSPQIEQEVARILGLARQAALEAGVQPDTSGSLGSLPYSQIVDLARKIKSADRKTSLKVCAKKDIYTIGPLDIVFKTSFIK
jgi:uncharacterized protein (DUF3084 family)